MIRKSLTILTTIALMAVTPLSCVTVLAEEAPELESLDMVTPLDGEDEGEETVTVTFVVSFGDDSQTYTASAQKGGSVSVPEEIASEIIVDDETYELSGWTDGSGASVDLGNVTSDMTVYASYRKAGDGGNDEDPSEKAEKKHSNSSSSDSEDEEETSSGSTASGTTASTTVAAAASSAAVTAAVPSAEAAVSAASETEAASVEVAAPAEEASAAAPDGVIVGIDPEGEVGGPVERQDADALSGGAAAGPVAPASLQTTEIADGPVALAGTTGEAAFPWWIVMISAFLAAGFGAYRFRLIRRGDR